MMLVFSTLESEEKIAKSLKNGWRNSGYFALSTVFADKCLGLKQRVGAFSGLPRGHIFYFSEGDFSFVIF